MNDYDIGDQARLTGVFRASSNDALVDPTEVTIKVRNPHDNEQSYTPVRDSLGVYHYDLPLTVGGDWYYRFVGTGAVLAAGEGKLSVKRSAFNAP